VTHARAVAPTVLAAVLAVVIALLGLDATVCFGRDGHVAAEPLALDHHATPSSGPPGATLGTRAGAHGPCTDVLFSGKDAPNRLEIPPGAMTPVLVSPAPVQARSCLIGSAAVLPQPASRSTVLRQ
jgi:hypothetical protein